MGSVSKLNTYSIQIKVLNVKSKQVIIARSIETDKIGNIRRAAIDLSNNIAKQLEDYGKKEKPVVFITSFQFVTPFCYLKKKIGSGFGLTFSCRIEDLFFRCFLMGIDIQYLYFNGKSNVTHHAFFVPITLSVGYRFPLWRFSIIPQVCAGASYDTVYYYTIVGSADYSKYSSLQSIAKGGLILEYSLQGYFQIHLNSEYGTIFENDGRIEFVSYGLGVGMLF